MIKNMLALKYYVNIWKKYWMRTNEIFYQTPLKNDTFIQ